MIADTLIIIHLMSDPDGKSYFCSPGSPDVSRDEVDWKHQDSREDKTKWFPVGSDIKCFVTFLDFNFNSNKRITVAN